MSPLALTNNLGTDATERLIEFCYPRLTVRCEYPPLERFDALNAERHLYATLDEFMDSLKMFVPFERYEEQGIYTNLWYRRGVYSDIVGLISNQ